MQCCGSSYTSSVMDKRGEMRIYLYASHSVFQGKHMPDGTESIAGEKMTLENVSPKDAGTYTCTAANGNGSPVSNRIIVNIEYKPIVELEEVFVHTQAGNKVEIVCKVNGHPHPAVEWRKDGEVIKKDEERMKIQHFGSK